MLRVDVKIKQKDGTYRLYLLAILSLTISLISVMTFLFTILDVHAQAQPMIVSIAPDIITAGASETLIITGSGFDDIPTVTMNALTLVHVSYLSTTTLTVTIPSTLPVGVYTVTVTNPGGLGDSLPESLRIQNPVPVLTEVHPGSASNDMDTQLVITGMNFVTTPMVILGNEPLQDVVWVSPTQLAAILPWGFYPGTYDLVVANPGPGTPSATLSNAFTVTQAIGMWITDGPYGGSVHHLAMDNAVSSTLYASVGLAGADGFFKSEDGGESWQNAFPGEISTRTPLAGFVLKPGDPQTVYLSGRTGTGDRLYRTLNGGADWEVIREGDDGDYALGVSSEDPDYLYAASGPTIVRSLDGGNHWEPAAGGIPNDAEVAVLAVHPVQPDVVYAGIEGGWIYKTVDGGLNWTEMADLGEGMWSALKIDPHVPDRIYASGWHTGHFFARSLDGGLSWEAMTLESGSYSVNDIAFHPTISGTIYVIAPGVYSSTNAGVTWSKVPVPDSASEGWSLLLHPQTGYPLFIGHNGRGVLYSGNGGMEWVTRNQGLAGLRPHEIAVSSADPRYIYVAADEAGGFSSNNGGQSWLAAEGHRLDRAISVAVHPCTPTIAYIGARRDVYKTLNGGQTWTRHPLPGLPDNNEMRVHAIAIDPQDPEVLYAGPGTWDFTGGPEYGWVYRSLNAGNTWSLLTTTLPISSVTDIEVDPTNSLKIYVATGRRFLDSTDRGTGILKSEDGGLSWEFINQGLTARSVSRLAMNPDNPLILYAGTALETDSVDSGVYRTVDGGEIWEQVAKGSRISGLAVDPLQTNTVYIGVYMTGLFRSDDEGVNWEREGGPLGRLPSESLYITTAPSRTMIFAGIAGGLLTGETIDALGVPYGAVNEEQFYGGGVYHLTIDRRILPHHIYLPWLVED